MTILIVEQNAMATLEMADRGYVLERGRVLTEGSSDSLRADNRVRSAYLGLDVTAVS
jgi:branched-chain amino acid transport system ATP-binding protein